jgi:hypothetical protein
MSGNKIPKAMLEQRIRDLIAGTQKHSTNGSLTFGGATYSATALVQVLQSLADSLATEDTARASWQDALKNVRDAQAKAGPIVQAYRSWLVATNGNAPSTLADYGLVPRKARTPLSTDKQAVANAKSKATRAARHTMGSKQKQDVKGTITTIVGASASSASSPVSPGPVVSVPTSGTPPAGTAPHPA